MKNLSLILNIVLLVAVGVLYYLHFSGHKTETVTDAAGSMASELKIAFVHSDSLTKNYAFLDANRVVLEAKSKKLEQEYRNRALGLQNEITNYQRNVNTMTLSQVKAVEEDLGKKQQNLQLYQQSLTQQLMEEEARLNKELYDRVTAYLKQYGAEKGIQIVLKYDPTSDVLYGGEALDITQEVITGLNEEYKKDKNPTGVKADSTAKKK
ncbi:MAG: OmpH family outer membrane protein [Cyclobacteriaceae bacterium]|nr:OmpH family outer membrane protein [Cyclobacteriaceae bacterium]